MAKTKFYQFEEEMLVQAKNKKDAIETDGYSDLDKEDLPYIEIISEQKALEQLSKAGEEGETTPVGIAEARRIIDENQSRILTVDASLI